MTLDYRLYLVTEESLPIDVLLEKVEAAVKGGVTLVQLREKTSDGSIFLKKAVMLKQLLDRYEIPLIINDRIDVALAADAAGVHIGQNDLPLTAVRKIVPASMIIGVSTATVAEAKQAENDGADYVGIGAVFPTKSKADAKLLPAGMLERIMQSIQIPAVAIGGITLENIKELQGKGLAGAAIVSGLMRAEEPYQAAAAFRQAWE
ncbi:thiamine phosphate synthase [Bacillus chungangensis]|uniref:Thiamine-phosphate synthase n=1 Tax=Bacillus chungangensis TaxID=587633 RepID=A0ABT9WSW0_9BACI|nr:thiamine phosphate synthase [Bacillus chungangensis]MDQ0176380.1 thiamine-phosphate pyrophosphorylase [Bacillus chungangensis]